MVVLRGFFHLNVITKCDFIGVLRPVGPGNGPSQGRLSEMSRRLIALSRRASLSSRRTILGSRRLKISVRRPNYCSSRTSSEQIIF